MAFALALAVPHAPTFGQSVFDDVDECDQLAAHPADPQRMAEGVATDAIVPRLALKACEAAARRQESELRFVYQLGRAHLAANRTADAQRHFERAAAGNYAPAIAALADLLLESMSAPAKIDLERAVGEHRKAMAAGFTASRDRIEALTFTADDYASSVISHLFNARMDAASSESTKPPARVHLYAFTTNLMAQCGPVLNKDAVIGLAIYRYFGGITQEQEDTAAVAIQPLIGEIDAQRFVRRHGCDGYVATIMVSNLARFLAGQQPVQSR